MRHSTILLPGQTIFVLIDVQERMIPAMFDADHVTSNLVKLSKGLSVLRVPTVITEQYPKGLGHTLPAIQKHLNDYKLIEKMHFSCCGSEMFLKSLKQSGCNQVIAAGIEAHVCVQQTVLDLLQAGYQVHVPFDCIASRNPFNRDNAIHRMREAGAIITNLESALFEILTCAGTDEFKQVQKLII